MMSSASRRCRGQLETMPGHIRCRYRPLPFPAWLHQEAWASEHSPCRSDLPCTPCMDLYAKFCYFLHTYLIRVIKGDPESP